MILLQGTLHTIQFVQLIAQQYYYAFMHWLVYMYLSIDDGVRMLSINLLSCSRVLLVCKPACHTRWRATLGHHSLSPTFCRIQTMWLTMSF